MNDVTPNGTEKRRSWGKLAGLALGVGGDVCLPWNWLEQRVGRLAVNIDDTCTDSAGEPILEAAQRRQHQAALTMLGRPEQMPAPETRRPTPPFQPDSTNPAATPPTSATQTAARVVLGSAMIFAGTGHLTFARPDFRVQVPASLPLNKNVVVLASGVVEIAPGG